MMKKKSKLLAASVASVFLMTATASASDIGNAVIGFGLGLAYEAIKKNSNNNNSRRGHTNLGPVNKQQRTGPAKQAPRPRNNAPSAVAKSAPKAAPARVADPQVLEAQKNLAALGFSEVGTPDGFAGKGTASAVKNFQKSNGLPETGVLSATVIALIAKDAMIAKNEPAEAVTDVAEIAPQEEFEPENFVATEVAPDPIPASEKVSAPEIEQIPVKKPEPVATAVASVATPETKTQEVKAVEPAVSENEW